MCNLPRRRPTRDFYEEFKIPYIRFCYKLWWQQEEAIQSNESTNIPNTSKRNSTQERLELRGGQAYDHSGVYTPVYP
jgi:hypothetical protein